MSDNPIYDQLIREHQGNPPGTFTMQELVILQDARRACSVPERPMLMPPMMNTTRRITPIIPLWNLRQRGQEDTQEMDAKTLSSHLG